MHSYFHFYKTTVLATTRGCVDLNVHCAKGANGSFFWKPNAYATPSPFGIQTCVNVSCVSDSAQFGAKRVTPCHPRRGKSGWDMRNRQAKAHRQRCFGQPDWMWYLLHSEIHKKFRKGLGDVVDAVFTSYLYMFNQHQSYAKVRDMLQSLQTSGSWCWKRSENIKRIKHKYTYKNAYIYIYIHIYSIM